MSNPYTRLKEIAKEFSRKVSNRRRVEAFYYTSTTGTASVPDLIASVNAAKTLGYETELYVKNNLLHMRYVEVLPYVPWELG